MMLAFEVPIRTVSAANLREHWATRARRVKRERLVTQAAYLCAAERGRSTPKQPLDVMLTRIAPRRLDDDNLRASLKGVRDELASCLGLPNDDQADVWWHYRQASAGRGRYAVRVEIEEVRQCGE